MAARYSSAHPGLVLGVVQLGRVDYRVDRAEELVESVHVERAEPLELLGIFLDELGVGLVDGAVLEVLQQGGYLGRLLVELPHGPVVLGTAGAVALAAGVGRPEPSRPVRILPVEFVGHAESVDSRGHPVGGPEAVVGAYSASGDIYHHPDDGRFEVALGLEERLGDYLAVHLCLKGLLAGCEDCQ